MGKIILYLTLSITIFSYIANAENEYKPKITFKDIVESQIGVIKKVMDLNKQTKELSDNLEKEKKKVKDLEQNVSKLQEQQQVFSEKLSKLEKEVRDMKLNESIKGLILESKSSKKIVGFGKPIRNQKEIIENGPENVFFCVNSVSYIHKYPSMKSVVIGASYKGDTLQCLTPCGLEGHKFYWLHIINLRTGYKGYSILGGSIKEGKCK